MNSTLSARSYTNLLLYDVFGCIIGISGSAFPSLQFLTCPNSHVWGFDSRYVSSTTRHLTGGEEGTRGAEE